ncbi:putative sulfate exporter family transporter [Embleya sp. NBC_00888]|uniref:YeiH family protein n=1 Tax=Embleya sp. NBC_00888 TaxID=2975960 RepID=UPI00386C36E1|nr:putative sulfate exporter family transporter [Embleya sp. NBC_00888]
MTYQASDRYPREAGGPRVVIMTLTAAHRAHPEQLPATAATNRSRLWPGLLAAAVAVAASWGAHRIWPQLPMLTVTVALGILAANVRALPAATAPGLGFAGKRLMRAGIVLLGLKLALGDIVGLGFAPVAMVIVVVVLTFFGTRWLGRRMGLPGDQPLLIATGFSICGASAVAAMNGVSDSDEEDVVTAVALVTLCGSLAIGVLPLLQAPLGLDAVRYGGWVGASVHDVGQVVAAGGVAGPVALHTAVVVKLMRVLLLAPIVVGTGYALRRRAARGGDTGPEGTRRPALMPLFVVGFLAMVAVRGTGLLPASALEVAGTAQDLLLAAALFGLGSMVDLSRLVRTGWRALLLGFASWGLIAGAAYGGVLLTM